MMTSKHMKHESRITNKDARNTKPRSFRALVILFSIFLISFISILAPYSIAAAVTAPAIDLNKQPDANNRGAFQIVQCDGPSMPQSLMDAQTAKIGHKYVPCDFAGLMMEIQFLLNLMVFVAVLAAIVGFAYAGYLYVTGTQENLKKARSMFPKILIGFILILTAWFIVYQILAWLTPNAASYLGTGS